MEIRRLGDKVLRQKAKRVSSIDDSIRNLCASMMKTMIENEGIGLAANQIGILKRIIIVLVNESPVAMINPEIVKSSENIVMMNEGCLSIPGEYLDIERPESIVVKYRDTKGKPRIEKYDGLTSRVIQHEIDHLDGVTMDTLQTVH
jgi:peptide deformylase